MQKPDFNLQKSISASYTLLGSILSLGGLGYYLFKKNDNIIWFLLPLPFWLILASCLNGVIYDRTNQTL